MMVRRLLWIVFFVALVFAGTSLFLKARARQVKHVFINETSDHRFDESIRVSILAAYKKTGVQNAVLISDYDSAKTNIDAEAVKAFKNLDLGSATAGRAILYYYSPANKSLKIEVGYALEGSLPDVMIRNLELAAKSFIYTDHYQDFWAEMLITLNNEIKTHEYRKEFSNYDFSKFRYLSGGAGLTSNAYSSDWEQLKKEYLSASEAEKSRFHARSDLKESINVYLESVQSGVGDPELDILTSESRFMRKLNLSNSYQLYRNARMYNKAGIDKIIMIDQLGFVFFSKNHPVLPIVLRQEEGVWRVHEPFSWSLFQRFEDSNKVFLKYSLGPMNKEFDDYTKARFHVPVQILEQPITKEFLISNENAFTNMRTTLLHFYWLDKVQKDLETVKIESLSTDDLKLAADTYMNLGQFTNFLKVYERLGVLEPKSAIVKANLKFYKDFLNFKDSDWVLSR